MDDKLNKEILFELGKFTNKLKQEVKGLVKEGTDIKKIIDFIESNIFKAGYLPSFPCTICINEVAAHFTVFDEEINIEKGDLVKVDFGVSKDGFATDNAFTIEVGTNTYEKLMDANREGLRKQLEKVNIGTKMHELGEIIYNETHNAGYETIHNLCGHQIARNNLHCGLSVPNYDNKDKREVTDNMQLAIEPYTTTGDPRVKGEGNSNILSIISSKPVRDIFAKKILDHIKKTYPHLPFSKRWLVKDVAEKLGIEGGFPKNKVVYAVNALKKAGILYEHDILVSADGSVTCQFEESVTFIDGEKTIITLLE